MILCQVVLVNRPRVELPFLSAGSGNPALLSKKIMPVKYSFFGRDTSPACP